MDNDRKANAPSFNAAQLKWLAMISMTVDHVAIALIDKAADPVLYKVMRGVGRLAFPIFAFFIVEGFIHSKNVKKYALRLFVLAAVSEVPFDLALYQDPVFISHQNTIWVLLMGLINLIAVKAICDRENLSQWQQPLCLLSTAAFAALSFFAGFDYDWFGILLIAVLYYFRFERKRACVFGAALTFSSSLYGPLAFIPLVFYSGERGRQNKFFFYTYYPAHLLVLGLLAFFGVL